jgi:hypothetical protein
VDVPISTSTALATRDELFSANEQLALAGFLAGYSGLTHNADALLMTRNTKRRSGGNLRYSRSSVTHCVMVALNAASPRWTATSPTQAAGGRTAQPNTSRRRSNGTAQHKPPAVERHS